LVWHFVSKLTVLSEDVSSEIIVTIFAVKKKEVGKCFRKEWRILKKEIKFFE